MPGRDFAWKLRTAALAADHAAYRYTATFKPKDKPNGDTLAALALAGRGRGTWRALEQAAAIAAGVRFARELGNLPPNICNPAYLAEQAKKLAAEHSDVACEILEREDMARLGMGSPARRGAGFGQSAQAHRAALERQRRSGSLRAGRQGASRSTPAASRSNPARAWR